MPDTRAEAEKMRVSLEGLAGLESKDMPKNNNKKIKKYWTITQKIQYIYFICATTNTWLDK